MWDQKGRGSYGSVSNHYLAGTIGVQFQHSTLPQVDIQGKVLNLKLTTELHCRVYSCDSNKITWYMPKKLVIYAQSTCLGSL